MSHRRFPSNSRVQLSADSPGFGAGRVDRSVAECPEGVQQAGLCFGGQVVRADVAECGDGFPDLLYVPFAVGTRQGGLRTWRSTSRLSPTYFPTLTTRHRISACSTTPARYPSSIAPVILAISSGSYGVLYAVAGVCAIIGAVAILPVKRVR